MTRGMAKFLKCHIQLIAQLYRIIMCLECRELFFCLERQKGRSKHAGERGLGCIIGFAKRCLFTMLCDEFGGGVEEVQQGAEHSIDFTEGSQFFGGVVACIADKLPHVLAVFLLHERVVVLVIAAGAGEENVLTHTPVIDLLVEELRAVVGIDGNETERQGCADLDECLFDPALGAVGQGSELNPAGHGIGGVERTAELMFG